jgi:hypothetical protein
MPTVCPSKRGADRLVFHPFDLLLVPRRRAAAMRRDATRWKSKTPALGQGGWELIPGFTVEHATLALLDPAAPLYEEKCRADRRQADRISRTH